jgi:hypothetical protein
VISSSTKIWKMSREILTNSKTNKKSINKKVRKEASKIQIAMPLPYKAKTKSQ